MDDLLSEALVHWHDSSHMESSWLSKYVNASFCNPTIDTTGDQPKVTRVKIAWAQMDKYTKFERRLVCTGQTWKSWILTHKNSQCQTYLQIDKQNYKIWTQLPNVLENLGIWDTWKNTQSDSPCGRTKYGTSVWKRDHVYKCVSLSLPRAAGDAKCKLCAREAEQEMDKIHGYIHKPKFDHSPFSKWITSTCMGLITPMPMPQEYKIGAQSGPCNTQVHRSQTILGGPLTQKAPVYANRLARSLR